MHFGIIFDKMIPNTLNDIQSVKKICAESVKIMRKLIGDKKFYRMVLVIAIPIMLQNGITNMVGLLDNMMMGWLGTEQMSGVSIVNQLLFVFNLCIFGATSGASIFGAQYYGRGDYQGFRHAFRFKIYVSIVILVGAVAIFLTMDDRLIQSFLQGGTEAEMGNAELTLHYAKEYLGVILFTLVPFVIVQIYASSLRETGRTVVPMVAGIVSVVVNLSLNWVLIFGNLGFPKLGVQGGALATVIARVVECLIVVIYTHRKHFEFLRGLYSTLRIPAEVFGMIFVKSLPLFINEALWSSGVTKLNQCYSLRSLNAIAALNINSNIYNISNIAFIALGSALSIIIGQQLGAGKLEEAKDTAAKLMAFNVAVCVVIGSVVASLSGVFPDLYRPKREVADLAQNLILISSLFLPLQALLHSSYFTLRSGGKTLITFFFDSFYMWAVSIPVTMLLIHMTALPLVTVYLIVQSVDILKGIVGVVLVKKGIWVRSLVNE